MANNRYILYCECGKAKHIGKSLGDSIYNMSGFWTTPTTTEQAINKAQSDYLESIYEWMWEHMQHKPDGEWFAGEAFKVLTEYDERIDYNNKEMFE